MAKDVKIVLFYWNRFRFRNNLGRNFYRIFTALGTYSLTYLAIIAWLTDFGLPQHMLPGASAFWPSTPVGHTNRWQGVLDFFLPMDTRSSSSPIFADPRIEYLFCRIIILHSNDMAGPVQPLDINTLHNVYIVKVLIQLTMTFLLNTLKVATSVLNRINASCFTKHANI